MCRARTWCSRRRSSSSESEPLNVCVIVAAASHPTAGGGVVAPTQGAPACAPELLTAPPEWRRVEFASDLHLTAQTFDGTVALLDTHLIDAAPDALFLLGDLFEVWVGDDAAVSDPFAARCADWLAALAARTRLFVMHGNRDFLLGAPLIERCGATLLQDPTVLEFDASRWLLSHGDALCTGDRDYLAFRAQVRNPAYQQAFLARPLSERAALARRMRDASEAQQRLREMPSDVDSDAARQWLLAAAAPVLIHGHTHRPAEHDLGAAPQHGLPALRRVVLSDWEPHAVPPRAQLLRLDRGAGMLSLPLLQPQRIDLAA